MAVSALGTGLTLPFLVVYLHTGRGLALPEAGLALGVAGVVGLAGSLVAGAWVDRLGGLAMLVAGLVVAGIGSALLAFVTTLPEAVATASLIAISDGMMWPALTSLVAATVPEELRPRAFSAQFLLMNLGIGVGGVIAGSFVSLTSVFTFQAIYVGDAVSFVAFATLLVAGALRSAFVVPGSVGARATGVGSYREVLRDRRFRILLVVSLGFVLFGYSQLSAGFAVFVTEWVRGSPKVVGAAYAANCLLIALVQAPVTRRFESRSRTTTLALGALLAGVAWAVLGVGAIGGLSAGLAAGLVIAAAGVFGIGETMVSPTNNTLTNELASPELRGRYNALMASMWGMASILGPPIATSLLALGSPVPWIATLVAGMLLTVGGYLILGRRLTPAGAGMGAS